MSRVTAWFTSNYPSVWTSTDPDYTWGAVFVTSDYVDSPSYLTVADLITAYPSGFPAPLSMYLTGRVDISGAATADSSGEGAEDDGTITQVIVMRQENIDPIGPNSYIAAVINLAAPLAVESTDTIIVYWDPAGIISPPSTVWSPTFAGGGGGGGGGADGFEPVPPAAPELTVDVYEADNATFVRSLTSIMAGSSGNMPLNDASLTTLRIPVMATDDRAACTRDRLCRIKINEVPVHTFSIGPRTQDSIATNRSAGEVLTVSGSSYLAHQWSQVRIDTPFASGQPRIDTLNWDWGHETLDNVGYTDSDVTPVGNDGATYGGGLPIVAPLGWPDPFSLRYTFTNRAVFRHTFTVSTPQLLWVGAASSFGFSLRLNGYEIQAGATAPDRSDDKLRRKIIPVEPGTYTVGIEGIAEGGGAGWVSVAAYLLDSLDDELNTTSFIFHTGLIPSTLTQYRWFYLDNPSFYIGMTEHQIVAHELNRAQARGALTGWAISSDDYDDSNEVAWDRSIQYTLPAYSTMWDLLVMLAVNGIDFYPTPHLKILNLYRWRERGTFHTSPGAPPKWARGDYMGADGFLQTLTHKER